MENAMVFQFFHWYYSPEGNLWQHLKEQAPKLAALGVTHVWLPPAYKSARGVDEPGYAVYDLYDLGEFDQKGTVRTRYGTKDEYLAAIAAVHEHGMQVLADIVLNHKMGGDDVETFMAQKVNADNRNEKEGEPVEMEAFTKFTFPGRKGKYSDFIWDKNCFTGFCRDDDIYIIDNEHTHGEWEQVVGDEKGNYDYLMGNDIEFRNPFVREELKKWGCWLVETTGIDGIRLDAVKHIAVDFFPEWLEHLRTCFKKDFWVVAEYWKSDVNHLLQYMDATNCGIQLLDVPLHFKLHNASLQGADFDMRTLFNDTLIQHRPELTVTFVDNHDTQPLQALESFVDFWFKPLANAITLLRLQGVPCVFYPSVYEGYYEEERDGETIQIQLSSVPGLETMMVVRRQLAYGEQYDYWDDAHVVGWTRIGIPEKERSGCAVLLSTEGDGVKRMSLGQHNAGRVLKDVTGNQPHTLTLDDNGEAEFPVSHRTVSVWVDAEWNM